MKKTSVVLLVLAVALLAGGQVAWAGNPRPLFANVIADAQCTVLGTDVTVDAGLIQKDAPSSGPFVSTVEFSLEQHFPNPLTNIWDIIEGSVVIQTVNNPKDLLAAGERYDVAMNTYQGICSLVDTEANAVRAVVKITVDNANPNRTGGKVFTGRCISFPNPCK